MAENEPRAHPARISKIRYSPCAHCTFIDLGQIAKDTLDFAPDYEDDPNWVNNRKANRTTAGKLLAKFTFAKRRRIATSRDTGWRIYDRDHANDGLKIECFQTVFKPRKHNLALERLLPDKLSFIPQQPGYYRENGFETCGLSSFRDHGWEEFSWNDRPFGFHVRSFPIRESLSESLETHFSQADQFLREPRAEY